MKKIFLILLLIAINSCTNSFTEKEMIGTYSPLDYKNTYDTIRLLENGVYHRKVYDKNKKLVLDQVSNYELRNGGSKIYFHSYFLNFDRDLVQFPELVNDPIGGLETPLERVNNKIQFCAGYEIYSNCYQKLK